MAAEHEETAVPTSPEPAPSRPEGDPLVDDDQGSRHGEPPEGDPREDPAETPSEAPADQAGADGRAADGAAAAVESDLEKLTGERDQYLALAQRTQADFENYRKRMRSEVALAEKRGMAKLARELMPALDTLDHALAQDVPEGAFGEGIRLVENELRAALGRVGIESYAPKGEPFDPQVHEAVSQLPVEGVEAGTVFEVMQQGYRHGDTVLRPARGVVAA